MCAFVSPVVALVTFALWRSPSELIKLAKLSTCLRASLGPAGPLVLRAASIGKIQFA